MVTGVDSHGILVKASSGKCFQYGSNVGIKLLGNMAESSEIALGSVILREIIRYHLILESFRIVVEAEGPMDLVKRFIMKNDWSLL